MYHEHLCPKGLFYDPELDSDEEEVDSMWHCSSSDQEEGQDDSDSGHSDDGGLWLCGNVFS